MKDKVVIVAFEGADDSRNRDIARAVRLVARDNCLLSSEIHIVLPESVGRHFGDKPLDTKGVPVYRFELPPANKSDDRWVIDEALEYLRRRYVDINAQNTVVFLTGLRQRVMWRHWMLSVRLWRYPGRFLRTHDRYLVRT